MNSIQLCMATVKWVMDEFYWVLWNCLVSIVRASATPWQRTPYQFSTSQHSRAFYLHVENCTALSKHLSTLLCNVKIQQL